MCRPTQVQTVCMFTNRLTKRENMRSVKFYGVVECNVRAVKTSDLRSYVSPSQPIELSTALRKPQSYHRVRVIRNTSTPLSNSPQDLGFVVFLV
jgi:hypothetical protein